MTERLHLLPRHRAQLEALLNEHLPDVEVWAYGSRVIGQSHDGSDLDLVLRGPGLKKIDIDVLADFGQALHDSTIPFLVEARDWARLPERFRREIEREYVVVRESREHRPEPAEWLERTWGDLATLEYGKSLRGYREGTGTCRVFGTNGPIGWHTDALADGPGVVIGRKGAYRGVHYTPEPFFVIDTAFYLKPRTDDDFEMRWAYYELLSQDINGLDSGSAIPSTSRDSFYSMPVRLPPLRDQRAITHVFGTLDDKVELNRRMNETLEAMARALFKSWFVDFDPVRAKMEGRDTGLPQDIADLFPDRLVDSEVGEIPEGWQVSEIGTEVDVVGGSTPSTKVSSYWKQGQHCWATPKDLSKLGSPVLLGTTRRITDAGLERISSGLLPAGTVLLSSRAPIGYLAIAEVPTAVNQGFIAMRCERRLPNLYVLHWCYKNVDYIRGIAGGSTFAEISKKAFRPVSVLVPPQAVLSMFEGMSRPLYDRLVVNERESVVLAAHRDALLPRLISGEIRVPDSDSLAGTSFSAQ